MAKQGLDQLLAQYGASGGIVPPNVSNQVPQQFAALGHNQYIPNLFGGQVPPPQSFSQSPLGQYAAGIGGGGVPPLPGLNPSAGAPQVPNLPAPVPPTPPLAAALPPRPPAIPNRPGSPGHNE